MAGFSTDFVSPVSYEHMAAEISFKGQLLCRVSQETPDNGLEVEFFHESRVLLKEIAMKFPAEEFLAAMKEACENLKSMNST